MHVAYLSANAIERNARELLAHYRRRTGQSILWLPIDIEYACEVLFGLQTKPVDFAKAGIQEPDRPTGPCGPTDDNLLLGALHPAGYPDFEGDEDVILVNTTTVFTIRHVGPLQSLERERFTIAHEGIGHYALHVKRLGAARGIGGTSAGAARPFACRVSGLFPRHGRGVFDRAEWQANRAAAAFLMPAAEVEKLVGSPGKLWIPPLVKGFCRRFGVSRFAMEVRLSELGYTCAGAVCTNPNTSALSGNELAI